MDASLASLMTQVNEVMLRDKPRFMQRIRGAEKIKRPEAQQAVAMEIEQDIDRARQQVQLRAASCPTLHYPAQLPVAQKKEEILRAIRDHQVVIVAGETGSGKTTQLPKMCLELGRGRQGTIGHTQPRRLAARSVATRVAEELSVELGGAIGYKVRFHDQISENTLVKVMTDGILLSEIQHDRLLLQYDTLIIDEAHERSLNIDFILGYLKQLLPRRPDLKVIITSATLDPERFSRHFNHAPIVEVSGRTYPVEVRYRPLWVGEEEKEGERDRMEALFDAIDELDQERVGDILIFMSGEREIRDTADALTRRELPHTEILPLYSRLSNSEQNRIFQSHRGRRIVLATNVAETSLTVPGIRYVIDPGTARISRYSFRTKVQRLPIEPISQASANQRKGRCGRVSEGICIRLYSEEDFSSRPEFTEPEILRTNLASVILQMTALGLGDMSAFPFVEAPDSRNIQDGVRLLQELGALEPELKGKQYQLTPLGKRLAQLPIDPRLARMIIEAQKSGCVREVMIITAALSIQDPRERPHEKQQASDEKHRRFADKESDFMALLNLWNYLQEQQKALSSSQFRKLCKSDYLNYLRVREWQDLYAQLRQSVKELGFSINTLPADYRSIHVALLSGLLSHIGQKDQEKNEFTGARNARFSLFPASGLFKKPPKWIMVAELVETSRLWGRIAALIDPEWIEPLALHQIKRHYSEPHWSRSQGAVMAQERVTLFGLTIVQARKINYSTLDPLLCRELFIRQALVEGDWQTHHRFFRDNRKLLAEVEEMEHKSRRRDILVDDETLFAFYDTRLPNDIVSSRHFDRWWKSISKTQPDLLNFEKSMLLKEGAKGISAQDYPNFWQQGNFRLRLSYQFEPGIEADGVTVHIPLQILNQIHAEGFDWQIPGLRRDLVIALIKSLPKPVRRNFVPAPNYAEAFLARVTAGEIPLLDALERELRRMTGVTVSREEWQPNQIPDHLKITFRVIDEKNKPLAEGSDLEQIKGQLKDKVQETLSLVADEGIEQQGIHIWNMGTLPQCYEQKRGGYAVKAYPALVDQKESVAVCLFESEEEQQVAMWQGTRRLLLLNIPSPIRYLHEKLPNKAKLGLYFNPFGNVMELIDDCIACGVDSLMAEHGGPAWQEEQFETLREHVRAGLNERVVDIARQVEQILTLAHSLNKKLKGKVDMTLALALADVKAQISQLIFPGFVTTTGEKRLADVIRYLRAIEKRLEKLPLDPHKDRAQMLKVQQLHDEYQAWRAQLTPAQQRSDTVQEIRWMLEELRVSYFAQQLGTAYPVSDKRLRQAMTPYSG